MLGGRPMKCDLCGKKQAIWKNKRKNPTDGLRYLCDGCMMALPNPVDRLDKYDYVNKKK